MSMSELKIFERVQLDGCIRSMPCCLFGFPRRFRIDLRQMNR